ncbi:hypothetical protein KEM56_004645 [Ascosphaera pollenicola]|nr:hypothetical protein KEM56_004645 [Ascosphaera pollenicola]
MDKNVVNKDPEDARRISDDAENSSNGLNEGEAHASEGTRKVEAMTETWSATQLWATFVMIYVLSFLDTLMESTDTTWTQYVTSDLGDHPLITTVQTLSTIVGGVVALPIAKIVNVWGRPEALSVLLLLEIIGLVVKAATTNIYQYAAGKTIFWCGHVGMQYIITVFLSDMTTMNRRALMLGINSTPSIATTFAGPAMANAYLGHGGWEWGYGTWAIIMPVVVAPIATMMFWNDWKAKKEGRYIRGVSGRTTWQSINHYFWEFDVIGAILITAGFVLLLLPLTLAGGSGKEWQSAHIIVMIVLGGVLLIVFGLYEYFLAPIQYLPWRFLRSWTVVSACVAYFAMFISTYCWDGYFYSYLMVVNYQSADSAGYILNSYSLATAVFSPIVGIIIERTGRYKWLSIIAIPLEALGTGLLVYFRRPGTNDVGYLCMCQIFIGAGGAIIAICTDIAMMAVVPHDDVATVLAFQHVFGSIGASMGSTISGAIWTNLMPGKLQEYLPDNLKDQWEVIYGDMTKQTSYPKGSAARDGIINAYGDVQRILCITGVCFVPLIFITMAFWKNVNLKKVKQTAGNVF